MRILLIRHAESENNLKLGMDQAAYQASRSADPGITEKGKAQSERLGLYLLRRKLKIKHMYCSGLVRSLHTAAILQKILKVPLEIKTCIHEVGGIYKESEIGTGKGKHWIKEHYPNVVVPPEITEKGWWLRDTKESPTEALERARKLVQEFKTWAIEGVHGEDECIALVSHGAFMDLLLAVLLERKEDSKLKLSHSNTGMTAFDFYKNASYQMAFINTAEHLDDDFLALTVDSGRMNRAIEYEFADLCETKEHHHKGVSEGFLLFDGIKNVSIKNKVGEQLKTKEAEINGPAYVKRETYDQGEEDLEKIKEESNV